MLGVSLGNRWDQSVLAVVGVPTSSEIADDREEGVPEEDIDQKIAGEGDPSPKCGRAPQKSAWGVDGGDQVRSRRGEEVGDSAPQWAVREIDSRLPQKDGRSHSQDKGPKSLHFEHVGTVD